MSEMLFYFNGYQGE